MIRWTVRAAQVAAVLAGLIGLLIQAARLEAALADDDNAAPASESAGGKPKPGVDRFAKAVRSAFALPKGLTYSQLSSAQQNKLDDLRTQKEADLREALEALQESHGSKDAETRHKVDDVRKEIRTAIDEILGGGGSGSESQPNSGSKYPSGSPPPSYPEQGYPPPYGSWYPGYSPYYGPGLYYPWRYGPWDHHKRPGQSPNQVSQNPPTKSSTPPKPQPKPAPKPKPSPPAKSGSSGGSTK
jgi:hypothetical protein